MFALAVIVVTALRIEFNPLGWKVFNLYNWDCGAVAFGGIILSAAKEIVFDKWLKMGTPQFYDAVWGSTGAILGPGAVLLIEGILIELI